MTRPRFASRIIITQPYVPANQTNIRKTFAAELKRLAEEKRKREADSAEANAKTVSLQSRIHQRTAK